MTHLSFLAGSIVRYERTRWHIRYSSANNLDDVTPRKSPLKQRGFLYDLKRGLNFYKLDSGLLDAYTLFCMAKYAIVFFPQTNTNNIQEFRKKYDPKSDLIAPHVTLVFPFPTEVDEDEVLLEIESKILNHRGFQVRLEGVHLDPSDGFLHFLVKEGKEAVVSLHDDLYSGVLNDYWRKDLAYKPHMTLGVFNESNGILDQAKYHEALKDLENKSLEATFLFDNVNLIKIEDQTSPRLVIKSFSLSWV